MVYLSSSIRLALAEKGQYDLLKMITRCQRLAIMIVSLVGARHGFRHTGALF